MSNNIIPKEQLTAYQRWEMAAFDEAQREAPVTTIAPAPVVPTDEAVPIEGDTDAIPPLQENLPYPTAEEIEAIHQQAYQEAFGEGQKAGFEQGFEQGLNEGRLAGAGEVERCRQVFETFAQLRDHFEQEVAQDVLKIALEVARQVLRQSIAVKPEMLSQVIREAIASLPAVAQQPRVLLNPADLAAVEVVMGSETQPGCVLVADESIQPGGCRIVAGNSEADAEIATRWRRVVATLGQQSDWLE
ncbi:flagellar assembly protein FliH [Chitinivorax tropicus]|uniref:Flagellar assembly protein FliH n=1 Tax=Chitinivorax tropicus TaxID=714531 RepID=A0A840MML3_9PROT|nr:flagellar assembly protein FliH [Chitinivorax tropicus]MBB5019878.1 flagellar assembly protein FliH [Chitinivorax tropicus]